MNDAEDNQHADNLGRTVGYEGDHENRRPVPLNAFAYPDLFDDDRKGPLVNGEVRLYLAALKTVLRSFCALPGLRGDCWSVVTGNTKEALERIAERHGITRQAVSKLCRTIEGELKKLGWRPVRPSKRLECIERCRLAQTKIRARARVAERLVMAIEPEARDTILHEVGRSRPRHETPDPAKVSGASERKDEPNACEVSNH